MTAKDRSEPRDLRPTPDRPSGLPNPEQTHKQVTVLFLDIVGSTALSQHLDPEDICALLDGSLANCTSIIEALDEKVLQYTGDGLLAAFGAGVAREDDPERAVQAGLELLVEARRQPSLLP